MKVKEDFHQLINDIEDEELLKGYYYLLQNMLSQQTGKLWNKLTSAQKDELLVSNDESLDRNNLVPHQQVKHQHAKWLNQ